jgi:dihydropteroate synthase-like protein
MPRYLFITGKLAEPQLRDVLADLAPKLGWQYDIAVLNITVAALMTPEWVARRLVVPEGVSHIYVPGACTGDWSHLERHTGLPVTPGPADVRDLADFFGQPSREEYGQYDIAIIAEINHAPKLSIEELIRQAEAFRQQGADVIDLGCIPEVPWHDVGVAVTELKSRGIRLSIDSFHPREVSEAVKAGAELVLSVNSSNREACRDWDCEVVAIPDEPHDLASLDATVDYLVKHSVKHRLDPILEPIGFGFGASLIRYQQTRQRYPDAEIMMGIGNLTELTEVDSAAVNLLLLALCQEWGIRSVLTTAVANFARSAVAECNIARRLTHFSINKQRIPKKIDPQLLTLRDRKQRVMGEALLNELAASLTDPNYRLFADEGKLHAMNSSQHQSDVDPFLLFEKLIKNDDRIDPSHAFYLGFELHKAVAALQLGKNYVQDQSLDWGYLTVPEISHRDRQKRGGGHG